MSSGPAWAKIEKTNKAQEHEVGSPFLLPTARSLSLGMLQLCGLCRQRRAPSHQRQCEQRLHQAPSLPPLTPELRAAQSCAPKKEGTHRMLGPGSD